MELYTCDCPNSNLCDHWDHDNRISSQKARQRARRARRAALQPTKPQTKPEEYSADGDTTATLDWVQT